MAEFSKLVITNKGQALLAKMMAGSGNIEFTKISASNTQYTDAQLEGLVSLSNVKQTSLISKITRTNEVTIKVEAAFSNRELTEGYYMKALGLYAVDPDAGEILYAVTRETSGNCYMPAYNGITVSGAYVHLVTTVGNAENVCLEVNDAFVATIEDIKDLQKQIADLEAQCAEKDETLQEQIEECVAKDETLQAQIEECAEENETLQAQIAAINAATYKHGTKVLGEPKSVFLISIDKVDMDKSYLEYDPSQGYDPELYLYLNEGLTFNPDTQVLCFNNPNNAFSADDFRGNSSSSGQSYWNYEYNNSAFFLDIRDNAGNNLMNLWVNNNIQYQYGFDSTFSDADDFISQITGHGTAYGKSNRINNYYAIYGGNSAVLPNEYRTLPPVTVNEQQLGFLCDKAKDGYIEYLLDCVNGKNLLSTRYYTFPNVTTNQTTGTYQEISLKNGTKYRFSADIKSIVGNVTHVMYRITNSSATECGFGNVRQLTVNNGKISDEFTTPPGSAYLNQDYKRLYIYSGFVSGNGPRRIAWENMMLKEII